MHIKHYLDEKGISVYKLAEQAGVAYPTVFNIVNGKVDIMNSALRIVKKIADALEISIDELILLCDRECDFAIFRVEQRHLVNRRGEMNYIIDVLETRRIDSFWKLGMRAEAFYLLAMIDYLSRRNDLPRCSDYDEIRQYKLEKTVYPPDTALTEKLLKKDIRRDTMKKAIPEFLEFNIVECEVVNE